MKTIFISYLVLILIFSAFVGCEKMKNEYSYLGSWTIVEYRFPGVHAMNPQEAEKYLDQEIIISEKFVRTLQSETETPRFSIKTTSTLEYLHYSYRIDTTYLPELSGNDSLTVVTISDGDHYITEFLIIDDSRMFTILDGCFFLLKKN